MSVLFGRWLGVGFYPELNGGARRDRTADLLHAIPFFMIPPLTLNCIIFNKFNKMTSHDFPACPIDTRKYHCYLVARWLLEIKWAHEWLQFESISQNRLSMP